MQTQTSKKSYFVPKSSAEAEQVIKRNRFICYVERCSNKAEAQEFIGMLKAEHAAARHVCWAYIAGDPHSTTDVGMTDDGEPKSTAGKPMLAALQYSGIGEIAAVVVRYSSGIKLGTGGLVRAYQGSVQMVLDDLELIEKVDMVTIDVQYPYNCEEGVRNFLDNNNIEILSVEYLNNVRVKLQLPSHLKDESMVALQDVVNGRAIIGD